jgi:hypothetical protein
MRDGGTEWQRAKRDQLDETIADLTAARTRLDDLVERTRRIGDQGDDLEVIGPISLEISSLRRLADRLGHELDAIDAEWAA